MKKRMLIVLFAAVLAASSAACGNGKKDSQTADTQKNGKDADSSDSASGVEFKYNVDDCVTLADYSKLKISLPNTYEVTKAQVDEYAEGMAEYNAKPVYKDTDKKKVEEGDTVNIDYEGKKDGVAFEGGTDTGFNLTIGSNSFIDGFEEGLIGKKVGETVDLNLTFPENYGGDLSGADVVFTVKINKIVEPDKSAKFELTDEYVKENLNFDTVKDYKQNIKEYLEQQNKSNKEKDTRQAVIDKLTEICKVTLPEGFLDARVTEAIDQFKEQNCTDGKSLADVLTENYNGMTEEQFKADITNEVEVNLNTELILEAIAKKEGLELNEEAFKKYVKQQMDAYQYATEEDFYKTNGTDAASGEKYTRKIFLCNRALDLVIDQAKIAYGVTPEETPDNQDGQADE